MTAPKLTLLDARAGERLVTLRMPFKFGIVTLRAAPQLFLQATIRLADGRQACGIATELLAPKWFDKTPELSNEYNFQQLRDAVAQACQLYQSADGPLSAFGLHAAFAQDHQTACWRKDLNPLIASFGTALLDRAIIDAVGRLLDQSFFTLVQSNALGIDMQTAPDLAGFDLGAFLQTLKPAPAIAARHTVGLVDAITESDIANGARVGDGLPESLEAAIDAYGLRYFKLKVGGDIDADLDRLGCIAAVLDRSPAPYFATLDGNEQYEAAEPVVELWRGMAENPGMARLCQAIQFIEQPIKRNRALAYDIAPLAALKPVEIDESDANMEAFLVARKLGYRGVSSKSCKGVYRSLLNRARVEKWNAEPQNVQYFMSAEDLTTQAGVAVQQDLALAALIGCTHVERNGHHYVNGMAGVPQDEQRAFASAHPDLYNDASGVTRLTIKDGMINIGSLETPGLGTAVNPEINTMKAINLKA